MKKYVLDSMNQKKKRRSIMNGIFGAALLAIFMVSCAGKSSDAKQAFEYTMSEEDMVSEQTEASEMEYKSDEGAPSMDAYAAKEEDYSEVVSSVIATTDVKGRKLIKTSDLRFKVGNVFSTTQGIEGIVLKHGGFVLESSLQSNIDYSNAYKISEDSSVRVDHITRFATLKVRVPSANLHEFLLGISPMIEYLDHRNISANDVTLTALSNELLKKRNAKYQDRLSDKITANKKLGDITNAENNLLDKEEQSDLAMISNLQLEDQIAFSTITMYVYQPQMEQMELYKDVPQFETYKEPFGRQLVSSFATGLDGLKSFILFLASIWEVLLILAIIVSGIATLIRYLVKR